MTPEERKEYNKLYREKNKEKIKRYDKKYYKDKKFKQRRCIVCKKDIKIGNKKNTCSNKCHKIYTDKLKIKIKKNLHKWYKENKEKVLLKAKIYRNKNKENHKKYLSDNKKRIRANNKKHHKKLYKNNIQYKIALINRNRINSAVKKKNYYKPSKGKERKCVICGIVFLAKNNQKTCLSPLCSKEYLKQKTKERNNSEYRKKYDLMHKKEIKMYMKKWNENKTDEQKRKHLKKIKEIKEKNPEKWKMYNREWAKNRYKSNIQFKIKSNLRTRMNNALKNNKKKSSSIKLLGLSILKYKQYIESQFNKNMSWDNHGLYWEIDHIQPLNTFDLTNPEEQLKAFNYRNTRPLEKILNRKRPKDGGDLKDK